MISLTATVEQAGDSSWTAALTFGENLVLGSGSTRDESVNDLRKGLSVLLGYLKSEGEQLPAPSIELIQIKVTTRPLEPGT